MSNVIGYAQVEKIRVLRVALLEAHRRAATTIKAGATWSQIEAEEEQAAVILLQLKAILAPVQRCRIGHCGTPRWSAWVEKSYSPS
jgi:hypothetical protein